MIVTAERREESHQAVPIARSAFGTAHLSNTNVTDTIQLSNFVPGLNISRGRRRSRAIFREASAISATPGNEAAIATYVDEVYYPAAGSSNYNLDNVARIEVLMHAGDQHVGDMPTVQWTNGRKERLVLMNGTVLPCAAVTRLNWR